MCALVDFDTRLIFHIVNAIFQATDSLACGMHPTALDAALVALVFFSEKPHAGAILLLTDVTSRLTFLTIVHGFKHSLLFRLILVEFLPPVHVSREVIVVVSGI